MARARVFPREARSILTRTGGFLSAWTHTLQPYVGCQFSCAYCYVREMAVQRTNPYGLGWSEWIAPRANAAALLARAAARGRLASARIFCASVTDPYVPLERRWRLTRACLEVLVEAPPAALLVQTRSPLVLRDADLLVRLPRVVVSVTVPTADEAVRRLVEPDSPSIGRRVATLRALREAGVRTQAAVAPLLPGDPEALASLLAPVADRVLVDDFFRGDGASGRRSRAARALLARAGHPEFDAPGQAARAERVLARRLGAGRVTGTDGWNELDGLFRKGPVAAAQWEVRSVR